MNTDADTPMSLMGTRPEYWLTVDKGGLQLMTFNGTGPFEHRLMRVFYGRSLGGKTFELLHGHTFGAN